MATGRHKNGLWWAADFVCTARCYWLAVFPRVVREIRCRRSLATGIPDPSLRRLALEALDRKRGNIEGAAAYAAIVSPDSRPLVTTALVACQAICDYLDLLAEQPSRDPVANGYRLHEALIVATTPGEPHRDYYSHHPCGDDNGYLASLVDAVRASLSVLPSTLSIGEPMRRASERIARYQSLNHGDAYGSYEPFERWAREATSPHTGLRFWETAAAAGSTLAVLALIASAADPTLRSTQASEIESAYFPWIGSLHSLLDSLVDRDQDMALEGRALMGYYSSPLDAASRMRAIAHEALQRARALPRGRHHVLITAAMTSFYISEIHSSPSPDAQIVGPSVLEALGGLSGPTMAILKARRNVGRVLGPSQAPTATPRLESQVPDFPLFIAPPDSEHTLVTSPMPIRSRAPRGGLAGPPTGAE